MNIIDIFVDKGPSLQYIVEEFLIDYCLEIGIFQK